MAEPSHRVAQSLAYRATRFQQEGPCVRIVAGDAKIDCCRFRAPLRPGVVATVAALKGSVKVAVGTVVGDAKLQSDGKADQTAGKIQNAVGGLKDTVREIVKK